MDPRAPTVYLLQAQGPAGPVKIGYSSRSARARARAGQTFHSGELVVLVETRGTPSDEAALHRVFAADRIRGEWFRYSPRIAELVEYLHEGNSLEAWLPGGPVDSR